MRPDRDNHRISPSGELTAAMERLRVALGVSRLPVANAKNEYSGVEMNDAYAERLLNLWGDDHAQLREHFYQGWCRLPSGGFATDAERMSWSRQNPWCPIPQNNTVRGADATEADGFLARMGMTCESWLRIATPAARLIRVQSSAIGTGLTTEQADAIRAAIDARCGAPPDPCVTPPVFRTPEERADWVALHGFCPEPGGVVPCPTPPTFTTEEAQKDWESNNPGCASGSITYTAPPGNNPIPTTVAAASNNTMYIVGGVVVAGAAAWWFMRSKAPTRNNPRRRARRGSR